jgi:hypothetical protein
VISVIHHGVFKQTWFLNVCIGCTFSNEKPYALKRHRDRLPRRRILAKTGEQYWRHRRSRTNTISRSGSAPSSTVPDVRTGFYAKERPIPSTPITPDRGLLIIYHRDIDLIASALARSPCGYDSSSDFVRTSHVEAET